MTFIDDKEIIKWACKHSASAIIISHNHPSGDPTPSMEDLRATKLIKSTRLVDIPAIILSLENLIIAFVRKPHSLVINRVCLT